LLNKPLQYAGKLLRLSDFIQSLITI